MGLKKLLKRDDIPREVKDVIARELENCSKLEMSFKELERQYKDLRRSKDQFRSLFKGVPIGLYRINPDGKVIE